jgi:uncharacterized protein
VAGKKASKEGSKKKGGGRLVLWIWILGLIVALGVGYIWRSGKREIVRSVPVPASKEKRAAREAIHPPGLSPISRPSPSLSGDARPRVAIVIDDLGYQRQLTLDFITLKIPLTLSFLPQAPYSRELAQTAVEQGKETLLHVPMEPKGFPKTNPGPAALLTAMKDEEIRAILKKDLDQFPGVRGINNHMGSLFTEDREKMTLVLRVIRDKNLYFFDSRTSPDSVVQSVAAQLGVKAIHRDIFLDNVINDEAIRLQLEKLIQLAEIRGLAVGCGHPHPETLRALKEALPALRDKVHFVPLSGLL